jgi:non-ribosomal peptide synthetase component F/thioesterase domain-containing protein
MDPLEIDRLSASSDTEEIYVLPASFGQERFWDLDRLNPGNPTWNVPVRFRLQGILDSTLLERAFNEIVRRHEVLRTSFTLVEGHPHQVIKPSLNIKVPVADLRHLPKAERDAEVDRLSLQEARFRFDLTAGPMFRVGLLQTEDNEHVLLVNPHHSVVDYWSIGIISNELGSIYDAYSRGQESSLSELSIQYGDYAVWQREQAGSEAVQRELAYWTEQLKSLPQLDFPTDRPRPAFPTYDATITSILLPTALTDRIKELANREETTFFNAMLAALSILMHQYTGQLDFGVATQVGGRSSMEVESLVGLFINTVVLRPNLAGDPTFSQLLARVREVGTQSIGNNNVRFEQVLKKLRPEGYPSHHTLFRLNFICQRDPVKPLEFAGIKLTVIPSKSQGALYDLHVFLIMRNEGWRLACEYNTDLFDAETITRLLADFRTLLEKIIENPGCRLSEFTISEGAAAARKKYVGISPANRADGETALDPSLPRSLGAAGVHAPESVEQGHDSAEVGDELSAERFVMPTSVAQRRFWVLEQIAPGNPALHMRACVRVTGHLRVDVLERSLQLLVDRHEILRTTFGKVDEELVQVVASSQGITLPVTSIVGLSATDQESGLWRVIRKEASAPFDLELGPLIRSRLISLGRQEHVLVITTHHILVDGWSQSVIQRDLWDIYEGLSKGNESPLVPLAVQYGDFVHWQQAWLASESCQKQLEFWTKQLASPVPVLNFPVDHASRNRPASKGAMETLLLPEDLVRSLKALSQSHEVTMFMLTLAAFGLLLHKYAEQDDFVVGSPVANRSPETEALVGPFSGPVSLRFNLSGNPTIGELLVRVREMTLEALSHAELPFEVLHDKLEVRSVHGRNPLSQCYFFHQTAFLQPRTLSEVTVTPLPDFALGTHFELQLGLLERREGLRAQLEYNSDLFESSTIQRFLSDFRRVLEAMLGDLNGRVANLPISITRRVPFSAETERLPVVAAAAMKDDVERKVTNIWERILGIKSIGSNQNYFELGGTSLLAVRLFAEVEKVFKVKLPLSTLFEAQTIAALAQVLRDGVAAAWSPLVKIQPGGSRPPFFCVHGGGGAVLIYRDLSKHLGYDQPFYGLQSQGLDGARSYLTRIEDMAALYVKEIKTVQPKGPYLLGGYCMGGTVAYEMAQQLTAAGEVVALLALFDTLNWAKIPAGSFLTRLFFQTQRLVFHGGNVLLLSFNNKSQFFHEKWKVLRSRTSVWRGMLLGKMGKRRQGEDKPESLILAEIWEINDRAILNYVPRPYPGVVTDFRPMKQYSKYGSESHWDSLALGGQEIVTLPVYPAGMLLEPFVKDLAKALKVALDGVLQRSPGSTVEAAMTAAPR